MKKTLILAAAVALAACNSQKYTIQGNIDGLDGTVYLLDEQENVVDSAAVKSGAFRFTGTAEQPGIRFVTDSYGENPGTFGALLILEPGDIRIADDQENPNRKVVTGTPANDANADYSRAGSALVGEFRDSATTDERREAIQKEYDSLSNAAVEANRDNYFGVLLLAQQLGYELSGEELLEEIALFSPEMQRTEAMVKLKENAEQKIKTADGQSYIDIEQPNAQGEAVSLKSVVENPANKLTLVDFWASWCGPCMGEVPHLKQTYDAFRAKGFEIYGVSFDDNREDWLAAVEQNGLDWVQVSDLNGFDNPAAKAYAVQSIPSNFLIDSQGKIVASNLRGEELYEKVQELLAE